MKTIFDMCTNFHTSGTVPFEGPSQIMGFRRKKWAVRALKSSLPPLPAIYRLWPLRP